MKYSAINLFITFLFLVDYSAMSFWLSNYDIMYFNGFNELQMYSIGIETVQTVHSTHNRIHTMTLRTKKG